MLVEYKFVAWKIKINYSVHMIIERLVPPVCHNVAASISYPVKQRNFHLQKNLI